MRNVHIGVGIAVVLIISLLIFIYYKPPSRNPISGDEALLKKITINLPAKPANFEQMKVMVQYNYLKDLSRIGEEYYLQPDWFPNYEICLNAIKTLPANRFTGKGYMSYPSGVVVSAPQGANFTAYFWFRSGCTVSKLQGIQLNAEYPEIGEIRVSGELPGGVKVVNQNPEEVKNYFDVSIDPKIFLLERSLPIMGVNYTKKISITVHVKDDTPEGNYVITISPDAPPQEYQDKWMWEYLTDYVNGGGVSTSVPYYSVFIHVPKQ